MKNIYFLHYKYRYHILYVKICKNTRILIKKIIIQINMKKY